jgi:hypothetical protein
MSSKTHKTHKEKALRHAESATGAIARAKGSPWDLEEIERAAEFAEQAFVEAEKARDYTEDPAMKSGLKCIVSASARLSSACRFFLDEQTPFAEELIEDTREELYHHTDFLRNEMK